MSSIRAAFDEISTDGFLYKNQLGTVLRKLGEKPSAKDICEVLLEMDANEDKKISFAELDAWYKAHRQPVRNSQFNKLLTRNVVGKTRFPTRDLPPSSHAFGKKDIPDAEGAREVVLNWVSPNAEEQRAKRTVVDRVKMNKEAVRCGCATAKEFTAHNRNNVVIRPDMPTRRLSSRSSGPSRDQVYGAKNRPSTPVKDLIEANDIFMKEASVYPDVPVREAVKARTLKIKMTAASKGKDIRQKEAGPKSEWKMKKFQNVQSRI
eukprot:TRINITY_DN17301_c0_g2_i1.p1 TRINITY_DN17301_c0_g2~~TRINITY_DN17301_c0_g2_i1.p1  ORF type:complete len:263 (+),score=66.73 TRINITY_DN17301_c0_g2_i1:78-866(+)